MSGALGPKTMSIRSPVQDPGRLARLLRRSMCEVLSVRLCLQCFGVQCFGVCLGSVSVVPEVSSTVTSYQASSRLYLGA